MHTITANELAFAHVFGGVVPASGSSAPATASSTANADDPYSKLYHDTKCGVSYPGGASCSAPLSDEVHAVEQVAKDIADRVEDAYNWLKNKF